MKRWWKKLWECDQELRPAPQPAVRDRRLALSAPEPASLWIAPLEEQVIMSLIGRRRAKGAAQR